MKTAKDFIQEMENSNLLMSNEHTFNEYVSELEQFQAMLCKMIAGDKYYEDMRINEALFMVESTARKYELRGNQTVHKGILAMKELDREIAIAMSGAKGERLVTKTLEYLERPNTQIFQNVYVADGFDETELDNVILTDSGIIILEVKNVKYDITLTPEGRMVFNDEECFGKKPLGEKMTTKRRLLKAKLENIIADKGLNIPIHIDSFIVFCPHRDTRINVNDQYHREKFCFRNSLNKKIENYVGCTYYKNNELSQLGEILSQMESNVKRFETKLNFDEIRHSLAEALSILHNASEEEKQHTVVNNIKPETKADATSNNKDIIHTAMQKMSKFECAASILGGLLISSALVTLGISKFRRI